MALFAEVFDEPGTYQAAVPDDEYLHDLLGGDSFIAVAAVIDDEVVGAVTAYVLAKPEQSRSEIYIYDLAVRADFRRQGVATGMIEALKTIARERGCHVIFVQADEGDLPAIALYESLGNRENVHHFDIPVD
jgi:aminoglycoside 3-N-acetyltransferase I